MNIRISPPTTIDERSIAAQAAIESLVYTEPSKVWRGTEIAAQAGLSLVTVMVALAILTGEGRIERVAPGSYRAPTATPAELMAQLDRELFGLDENP